MPEPGGRDGTAGRAGPTRRLTMFLILFILILALLLGGLGFAIHALWWIALVVLVVWLVGFVARRGEGARWYRW